MGAMRGQKGVSLIGLVLVLAVIGTIGIVGMKVFPSFMENRAVENAIKRAAQEGADPASARIVFDKNADISQIDTITGKDLQIDKVNGSLLVSYEYTKKIPLFGPVSLLIDYSGSARG